MEIVLFFLMFFTLIILMALLSPLEFTLTFHRAEESHSLLLNLQVWSALKFRFHVYSDFNSEISKSAPGKSSAPGISNKNNRNRENKKKGLAVFKELLTQISFWRGIYSRIKPSIGYFISKLMMTRLDWKTRFGLGDPYYTGMASGIIWTLKETLISCLYRLLNSNQPPALNVLPDFNKTCLAIDLKISIRTKAIYLVIALLKLMTALLFSGRVFKMINMIKKLNKKAV